MSTQAKPLPPEPPNGRRLIEWARIYDVDPSKWIRDIRRGRPMSDGSRLYLRATYDGGCYRVRQADIEAFQAALTADRLGSSTPSPSPSVRTPAQARREHESAERELAATGW